MRELGGLPKAPPRPTEQWRLRKIDREVEPARHSRSTATDSRVCPTRSSSSARPPRGCNRELHCSVTRSLSISSPAAEESVECSSNCPHGGAKPKPAALTAANFRLAASISRFGRWPRAAAASETAPNRPREPTLPCCFHSLSCNGRGKQINNESAQDSCCPYHMTRQLI